MFSLLPPDNATGNFTKIVQRLPVRIQVPADARRARAAAARHVGRRQRRHQGRRAGQRRQPMHGRGARAALKPGKSAAMATRCTHLARAAAPPVPAAPPRCPRAAADRIDPRRLVAFLAMVFGMFMAILDIQIVSASLTEIQAGLAASADEITWVQTAYLIAEVVMIPLSGFLSRALGTRILFADLGRGLHRREPDVRAVDVDRRDDRLARDPGLHRRRHDPDRVRLRLSRSSRARAWA